jgi:hypothetical protein
MIKTVKELDDFLTFARHGEVITGIFVSTKVRRDRMLSSNQNRIARNGRLYSIQWTNMSGGVWLASLNENDLKVEL